VDGKSNDNQLCSADRIEPTLSQKARKDGAPTAWREVEKEIEEGCVAGSQERSRERGRGFHSGFEGPRESHGIWDVHYSERGLESGMQNLLNENQDLSAQEFEYD